MMNMKAVLFKLHYLGGLGNVAQNRNGFSFREALTLNPISPKLLTIPIVNPLSPPDPPSKLQVYEMGCFNSIPSDYTRDAFGNS